MKNKFGIWLYAFIAQFIFFVLLIVLYEIFNRSLLVLIFHLLMLIGLYVYLVKNKKFLIEKTGSNENKFLLKFYGWFALAFIIFMFITLFLMYKKIIFVSDGPFGNVLFSTYMVLAFPLLEILVPLEGALARYGYASIKEKNYGKFSWLLVLFILIFIILLFIIYLFI